MHPRSWVVRRLALLLILVLLGGALPTMTPMVAAQASDDKAPEVLPRADKEVDIQRGRRSVKGRPLKTVTTADGREALADRIIVGFREAVSEAEQDDAHQKAGHRGAMRARAVAKIGKKARLVDVSRAPSLDAAIQAYRADARVAYAEPDYIARTLETPNDPAFSQQWGMARIQAPAAWDVTHGSPARIVAVLDCGIYEDGSSTYPNPSMPGTVGHGDINSKVVARQDFTGSATGTDDYCNHGTHVAGIVSANTNNGLGVAGVGYETRLMNVKVLDDLGSGNFSGIAAGIHWAVDNGAQVINMSLGAAGVCGQTEQDAITYAWDHNVVVIVSAGNRGTTQFGTPASCANTVAVASTDANDVRSTFSTYGTWVDVAAPGSDILSTDYVGGYASFHGTSMAAPHVAGLAALVAASCDSTSAAAIVERLTSTADRTAGTGSAWRHGRINAARAVCAPPTAPGSLRLGAVTASSIQVRWNDASSNETTFQIASLPVDGATWSYATVGGNMTAWTHAAPGTGAGYHYFVRACNGIGCSPWSNYLAGTTQAIYRVELSWAAAPLDLDAHLWLPAATPYHVYHARPGGLFAAPRAALNLDARAGMGPESIAIGPLQPGVSTFAVYNASNERALAGSKAIVRLYRNNALLRTFTAPSWGTGRWWHVFQLSSNGSITNVNRLLIASPGPYAAGEDEQTDIAKPAPLASGAVMPPSNAPLP